MIQQDVAWNVTRWNDVHDWPESGEEWSKSWGSSQHQWQMTILPRVINCLPARNVVEIAPGWGRWTRFLMANCSTYLGFDISEKAIDECRKRFCFEKKANFQLNDGKTIGAASDKSIDFIFSMDSLVHAEVDAIEPYIKEFARVLSECGTGFIHHSNMGEHNHKSINNPHQRATSVSADVFRGLCEKYNLKCIAQEKINWGQSETNDCFSLFARSERLDGRQTAIIDNKNFHLEIENAGRIFNAYHVGF